MKMVQALSVKIFLRIKPKLKRNFIFCKMKIQNLAFILFIWMLIVFPQTHQFISGAYRMSYARVPIRLDDFLLHSLNFLQQKLTSHTFTDEDMLNLSEIIGFIVKRQDNINKSRVKERTVYWLLRQGR